MHLRTLPVAALVAGASLLSPHPTAAQRWTLPETVQRDVDSVFAFVGRDDPGCALGVIRDGTLAYGRGYGLANLDLGVPLGTASVFDIGSVSKQFTATAIALLDMDGVLSLDDDVHRWIPELPDYGHPLTIRHLLNHTSGVRDYLTLLSLAGFDYDNVFDEHAGIDVIVRQQALNFTPGSEYLYSNSGYLMLANIVRRATGESLRAFLQRRVFDPLGMAHTSIWDDNGEVVARRATGYGRDGRGSWRIDHAWNFQMGGDGQVLTSIEDLAKWDANFYDPVVGGSGLMDRLHTRGVLNSGDTIAYALGLSVDRYRGLRRVSHGGSWAGFRAQLTRFPDQRTSIIVECNRRDANPGRYVAEVADRVLAYAFTEEVAAAAPGGTAPAVTLTPAQLQRWAGLYRHAARPEYVRLEVGDGALTLTRGGGRLTPVDETTFRPVVGQPVRFADDGATATMTTAGGTYRRVAPATTRPAEVARVAGSYRSEELAVSWTLEAEGGTLVLLGPDGEGIPLEPGAPDEWFGPATITVVREGGRVTGLRVFAGRVTGIVFAREGA
jgi:CubicO group peptidase (beta-lactamase class C family)